jgi:Uri superfamily endonuclease
MSAMVVPFPLARRLDLIHRQAEYALCLKPEKVEQHIARQLQCQADALRRRGISDHTITQELTAMEAAIRAAMWHTTFDTPSGKA